MKNVDVVVITFSLLQMIVVGGSSKIHFVDNPHIRTSGSTERRRILVAPSELEEQRGCAVLAFREWIAPLAIKTSRALVIPSRFANIFNFSSVAEAWKNNCDMKDVVYDPHVYKKQFAHLCDANSSTSFHLRIEKEWSNGGGTTLSECSKTVAGVDKCIVLKGQASLFELLKMVPELLEHVPCFVITHGARGFKTTKDKLCQNDNWNMFDYAAKYHELARSFALKQHPSLQMGPDPDYVSAHFRTEKWSAAAAISAGCWAQIGLGLGATLRKFGVSTVFLGTDVGHSFSYGQRKQQETVAKHMKEQVVLPLQSLGFRVIVGSECSHSSGKDTSVECATVDQILMASAKVFVHMYHKAPSACTGASSGSCYGQWILRNRSWRELPSFALAKVVDKEERGLVENAQSSQPSTQ